MEAALAATEMINRQAREDFMTFIRYNYLDYEFKWFHELIASKCQGVNDGSIKKLMIFVPPQHAKSTIVSQMFPAWALGKNPDLKFAGASYSIDLARTFSRNIQRVIDSQEYNGVFPETTLNKINSRMNAIEGRFIRNVDQFEVVGHKGYYKATGVCGPLTGTSVDIGLIDDPVKDAIEAYSETYRNRVWEWYLNVFLTRLHNDSRQILIQTRWHDDDLAGRILKLEGDKWEVVILPAIKEKDDNPDDPREVGEALWPEKHSLERLLEQKGRSERVFNALYQQNPVIEGGNIIKSDWFRKVTPEAFNRIRENHPVHFFMDTAYTDDKRNDPSGIIATCRMGNDLYILNARKVMLRFPDLCRFIPKWVQENLYSNASTIRIEPKANGLSVIDQLREVTHLNVTRTPTPDESKETRLNLASSFVESGRVVLVEGPWNDEFVTEVCGFPARPHDEYVDLLCYAIDYKQKKAQNLQGMFH